MKMGLVKQLVSALLYGSLCFFPLCSLCSLWLSDKDLDPAAWGSDHVGRPVPEYVTGEECLFCHRNDVGPAWTSNRHHRTLREAETEAPALAALKAVPALRAVAEETKLLLGNSQRVR